MKQYVMCALMCVLWVWPSALVTAESDNATGRHMSLHDVLLEAYQRNLDIQIEQLKQAIQSEEYQKALSIYDGELSGVVNYTDDRKAPVSAVLGGQTNTFVANAQLKKRLTTGTDVGLFYENTRTQTDSTFATLNPNMTSTARLEITQPLLRNIFGRIDRLGVQLTEIDVRQFELETQDRIEAAFAEVKTAYWQLVLARRLLEAREGALEKAQELLRIHEDQLERGLVEETALLGVEANLHLRTVEWMTSREAVTTAQQRLGVLLDDREGTPMIPTDVPGEHDVSETKDEAIRLAMAHRRDYQRAQEELRASDIRIRRTANARWPQLDLMASLAANGLGDDMGEASDKLGTGEFPTSFVGVEWSVSLENREAKAEHAQAIHEKARALLEFQQLEMEIIRDVDRDYRLFRLAINAVRETQRAEVLHAKKLEQVEQKFQFGRSTSQTLIDYQEDLIDAQARSIRALVAHERSYIQLQQTQNILLGRVQELVDADF